MSYRVEQKIRGHIYIYEADGHWDPDKKQCRQKRTYLGKKDPETGELITAKKSLQPKIAQDYGSTYLLKSISEQIGLTKTLKETDKDRSEELLMLAMYQIIEERGMYLQEAWSESTYLNPKTRMSVKEACEFVKDLGHRDDIQDAFFRLWQKKQQDIRGIHFDITSFSSYAKSIEGIEWGYNRDGESLPQINVGLMMGKPSGLPLFFNLYPGSIADVSTLKNTVQLAKDYGVQAETLVLDRGFYSQRNLDLIIASELQFVMPMPFQVKTAQNLVSKTRSSLQSPKNGFLFQGKGVFHVCETLEINQKTIYAHVYFDETRRGNEVNTLLKRLDELETKVSTQIFYKLEHLKSYMESAFQYSTSLYSLVLNEGVAKITRKTKALSRWMNRMGKVIMITNDPSMKREDVLAIYREKDEIEKLFNIMKNELGENRLRVHSTDAMRGRLFLMFLATILYKALSCRMKESGLFRKYTIAEVLLILKQIKAITLSNNQAILSEISKKHRDILTALKIPIPETPCY